MVSHWESAQRPLVLLCTAVSGSPTGTASAGSQPCQPMSVCHPFFFTNTLTLLLSSPRRWRVGLVCLLSSCSWLTLCPARAPTHPPPLTFPLLPPSHPPLLCSTPPLAVFLQLGDIVSRTRTIKAAVEAAVSKQFAGRRVNVLGEINNALSASA